MHTMKLHWLDSLYCCIHSPLLLPLFPVSFYDISKPIKAKIPTKKNLIRHFVAHFRLFLSCLQVSGLPGSVFNLAPSHMFGNRLNPNSAMAARIAQSEASPAGTATYLVCVCVWARDKSVFVFARVHERERKGDHGWVTVSPLCPTERSRVSTRDIFKLLPLSSSYTPWHPSLSLSPTHKYIQHTSFHLYNLHVKHRTVR